MQTEFHEPRLSRNLELANLLGEIGYPHNVPAGIVAIAWTLRNPAVTGAIIGSRSPAQIEEVRNPMPEGQGLAASGHPLVHKPT